MDFITLSLFAFGLSADAFAVAVTDGIFSRQVTKKDAITTGLTFGFYQAFMPILGYLLGNTFSNVVSKIQHWIALFLLCSIGINMLTEALKDLKHPESISPTTNVFSPKNLTLQGIATSIDALAAGVSLAVLKINIFTSAALIGFVTSIICILGVIIGKKFNSLIGFRARILGGSILILIAIKIFVENQFF